MYAMGTCISPESDWPKANDCSGLILWCFGLLRQDFPSPKEGSTDAIYKDILSANGYFVRTPEPRVGGIIIYPGFKLPGWTDDDSGHVGLIKSVHSKTVCSKGALWPDRDASEDGGVEERLPLEIYDCSSTSWWTFGDAVRLGDYNKFLLHDQLMVAARKANADPSTTRRPIYAVIRGDKDLPVAPPTKVGHCPGQ